MAHTWGCSVKASQLEVFTEDPRPEDPGPDPGPVRVRVYILNGQPGPGRVPIYYFGSQVFLTLCVIPESIGEHRTREWSVSVSMHVFCNLQFVKLRWEKCEREIRWKKNKKTRVTSAARNRARAELMLVLQADGDHGFESSWVMWKKSCISHPSPWQQVDFLRWNNEWIKKALQTARERNSLTWMEIYWQGGLYASQSGRGLLTVVKAKRFFFLRNFFIDLIAFAVQ